MVSCTKPDSESSNQPTNHTDYPITQHNTQPPHSIPVIAQAHRLPWPASPTCEPLHNRTVYSPIYPRVVNVWFNGQLLNTVVCTPHNQPHQYLTLSTHHHVARLASTGRQFTKYTCIHVAFIPSSSYRPVGQSSTKPTCESTAQRTTWIDAHNNTPIN